MTLFQQYKRQALEREFSQLNPQQRQAAFSVRGPLLILAGAGSGKTTVLIRRIAYLLQYGNAYHGITYIDYTTGQSYNPDNFRSWTYEQAHP